MNAVTIFAINLTIHCGLTNGMNGVCEKVSQAWKSKEEFGQNVPHGVIPDE
jgi:hypothetical protein